MSNIVPIGMPQLVITANDEELNRRIVDKAVSIGRGLAAEFEDQMRLLVRDVVSITPPSSGKDNRGRNAYRTGVAAINRDLFKMGIVPVEIKGVRKISHVPAGNVKGRPAKAITPVTVKTTVPVDMPKSSMDLDLLHYSRITSKHGGHVTRGRAKAYYVNKRLVSGLKTRLYSEIGRYASGWISIAHRLGLKLDAWIERHEAYGAAHGYFEVNFDPSQDRLFIHAINFGPDDSFLIAETQRRVEYAKTLRINAIKRGLEGRAKRLAQAA